jgi:hypothetical protein
MDDDEERRRSSANIEENMVRNMETGNGKVGPTED